MSPLGKLLYALVLLGFGVIILLALLAGSLPIAGFAVLFGALFAITAPFVLGRRWRAPAPSPRRRPVRRRR
jgi:hypothetical protein